jgi:hypothetical protein
MREIRTSGSEGGGDQRVSPYPYHLDLRPLQCGQLECGDSLPPHSENGLTAAPGTRCSVSFVVVRRGHCVARYSNRQATEPLRDRI